MKVADYLKLYFSPVFRIRTQGSLCFRASRIRIRIVSHKYGTDLDAAPDPSLFS
jgi:hypothetical protein